MTDREKLYELIVDAENELYKEMPYHEDGLRIYRVVDYLIENGVTVRQMQKPLTVEKLKEHIGKVVHLEYAGNKMEDYPVLLGHCWMFYAEFEMYGAYDSSEFILDDYGKTWRCWAKKPTEEEREAAEWEK